VVDFGNELYNYCNSLVINNELFDRALSKITTFQCLTVNNTRNK